MRRRGPRKKILSLKPKRKAVCRIWHFAWLDSECFVGKRGVNITQSEIRDLVADTTSMTVVLCLVADVTQPYDPHGPSHESSTTVSAPPFCVGMAVCLQWMWMQLHSKKGAHSWTPQTTWA